MPRTDRHRADEDEPRGMCNDELVFAYDLPGSREPHECTLQIHHFGPHLCWCGILFQDGKIVGWQQRLHSFAVGTSKTGRPRNPG